MKKFIAAAATAAVLGMGCVALSATAASARVVCNADGDCWHTDRVYNAPGVHFTTHPDDWYFHQDWERDHDHHWRGYHEGRGYWRGGVWIPL